MSVLRKMWNAVRVAWYDPAGIYSEHGREGI